MWEEGKKRERIDWHEWSMFVPPAMWFHEHFNTSVRPVRFLAFHPPGMLAYPGWSGEGEHFIGKGPNQIEYEDEDPEIRKTFEYELAKNGLVSRMPRALREQESFLIRQKTPTASEQKGAADAVHRLA